MGKDGASQKADMVDVAYQVGDPAQFRKAWAALSAGDMAEFAKSTKVFCTNQAGDRVEDTRRNNLRANMLAGIERWNALVTAGGRVPNSKLDQRYVGDQVEALGNTVMNGAVRAVDHIDSLGIDYSSPEGKTALRKRVQEASKGGSKLTPVENLRARQAQLINDNND